MFYIIKLNSENYRCAYLQLLQLYKPLFSIRYKLTCAYSEDSYKSGHLHRGSYMSAHVLLNLLNKLEKRDKMGGLPSILSLFRNKFNKFNNIIEQMLDSIYHMTLRLL